MRIITTVLASLIVFASGIAHAQTSYPYPVPLTLTFTVREIAGVARTAEIVRSGLPIPRALNVRDVATLTIVDSAGVPVPADFTVMARWDAGRDVATAPIQWLLVTFPATVAANATASYRLFTDGSGGSNPIPPTIIQLTQAGNQITVNTGAATFRIGTTTTNLFDEIRLPNNTALVSGGEMTARTVATTSPHNTTRRVVVEHLGRLSAVVSVEGAYDVTPVGLQRAGGLGSRRRYVFTLNSPTVIVRQSVAWEGDHCGLGNLRCGGTANGVEVEQIRDAITVNLGAPVTATVVGQASQPALQGTVGAAESAFVRQRLRALRTAPLAFDSSVLGGTSLSGVKADGALLAASGSNGAVAIALDHMHRYEPQALRLLNPNTLAIDLADDRVMLGTRQGLFATFAVSALAPSPTRADLDRAVWAPLNHPLRAWPSPAWFASSDAVDEFPVGPLQPEMAGYDTVMQRVLDRTSELTDTYGLAGLMTFGLYPRTWANPILIDEVDCIGGIDPTPGQTWDDLYWCATWTDYHQTVTTAPIWAMRTGQVQWLDEIAVPGALRMLHTQILQCAPDDTFRLCAQAPTGYGGYRADFNASHQYWDNLFLYYWLTGDYTVVETLGRGGTDQRRFICQRRPGAPCLPDDPPPDPFALPSGRVGMQWQATFRFLGLASADATYLEDYRANLARAVTQWYVEAQQSGTAYGFWTSSLVGTAGPMSTDQLWMTQLYDMNVLFRLQRDTNDAPIGNPPIPPSQVLGGWARTLVNFAPSVPGSCRAQGTWPNALNFNWSGARIGGTLVSVSANETGSDPCLYESNLATVSALLVRVGDRGNNPVREAGAFYARRAIMSFQRPEEFVPLSKIQGIYFARLHAAVGRLTPLPPSMCSFLVLPATVAVAVGGGSGTITLSDSTGCAWTAASNSTWLTLNPTSGLGSNTITWTAAANSGAARTATLTIAGETVTVTQAGSGGSSGPVNLAFQITGARLTLTWSPPPSGPAPTGYVIEAGTGPGLTNIVSFPTGSTSTTFVTDGVPAGTYYVRVRAMNGSTVSAPSNEVVITIGAPGPPTQLTAAVSGNNVTLNWVAPTSGTPPTSYLIQAGSGPGLSNLANFATGSTSTTFGTTNVPTGVYYVRVLATTASGSSAPSNEVRVLVGPLGCTDSPLVPTGLNATVTGSRVDLRWTQPAGGNAPLAYVVDAGFAAGQTAVSLDTGSTTTSMSANAPPGTYFVRVRARNACGSSAASTEITVTVH